MKDIVFKHAPILENEYSYENLITFAKKLKKKIPSLDWFIRAFENIGWSDHFDLYAGKKNKERVQIVLEIVEKYIAQTTQINVFTIEHILPDSMSILNSQIGNLIPLERKINENCATEALVEKIEKYKKSQFASTRGFAERFSSQEFKPENRTKYLARLIFNNILELNQTDFSDDE